MRLRIVISALFLFVACVWISGAIASPYHHHEEYQTVSPFDKKQDTRSAHCILRSHTHLGFCPHMLPKGNAGGVQIAPDCGGKAPGAVPPNTSASKNLTVLPATGEIPIFMFAENMTRVFPLYDFHLPDPLDHPPRFS